MPGIRAFSVILVGLGLAMQISCYPQDEGKIPEEGSEAIGSPFNLNNEAHSLNGSNSDFNAINADTICLGDINQQRSNHGKSSVDAHSQVEQAAYDHNAYMLDHNCFSHQCPGEAGLGDRLSRTGYRWGGVGEIIAKGQGDCRSAVQAWMNSQGHKDIMLGNYRHVGCSGLTCSNCQDRGPWWTCVFANPM